MAEYYKIPRFGIGGLCGSKCVDQQAALEAALTLLAATQAGAQLIHDVGYMDNGTTSALDQVVICHEIIGWVKQYMQELVVDEDTLALDLIDQIVQTDGDFLSTDHTAEHFRIDHYPDLLHRHNYDAWQAEGDKTLCDTAKQRVDEILSDHKPEPLPADVSQRLRNIVEERT